MAKPDAPPRRSPPASSTGPVRTRLAAGTTRLTTDVTGRIAPAPPPLEIQGQTSTRLSAPAQPRPTSAPATPPVPEPPTPAPPPTPAASAEPAPDTSARLPDADTVTEAAPEGTAPQVAARPAEPPPSPAAITPAGGTVSVLFDGDSTILPDSGRDILDRVAAVLDGNSAARATVRAYADGGGDANQARRTSLSRALSVRAYLIDKGVASARIDVRALGNQSGNGNKDRVDVVTAER
jgi:outer membrane protein OmpA-like peptidoglycan-associated protein